MEEGEVLAGRYRIARFIASGGMGSVWEATDTMLAQPVALKHVTFTGQSPAIAEESRQRTLREARNAARLRGESGIISIYDVLPADDGVWLVLEYLPSSSLGDMVERSGSLGVRETARIGAEVAAALAAAHRRGVVHRDVKPGNVLIAEDGRVKLTDFGIAHAEGDTRLTSTGLVSGTPAYMAREVAAGEEATAASDVFSLASTLYRAVEGTAPFGDTGSLNRLIIQVATAAPQPTGRSGVLAPLLMRMFDPDPARRPGADDVAQQLRAIATAPDRSHQATGRLGATTTERPSGGAPVRELTPPPRQPAPEPQRHPSAPPGPYGWPAAGQGPNQPPQQYWAGPPPQQAPQNGAGVTALVLGILAFTLSWLQLGWVLGPLAIIFGGIGLRRASAGLATNRAAAAWGLVTGALGLISSLLIVIALSS